MTSTTRDLLRRLRPLQRRLRMRNTLGWAQRTAWLPGTACILIQALGRLIPIPNLTLWSFAPLFGWALALLGFWVLHRLPPPAAARRVDLLLDLRERISTALELSRKDELDELEQQQQVDALATAMHVEPKQIGWAFERRSLAYFAVPLLLGAALILVPNPQDLVLAEQAATQQAVAATIKQIDQQEEKLKQNKKLSEAERERLLKELEQLKQELQANPKSREEALAKLSTTEAQLRQQLDPLADARRAGLEQLARRLKQERGEQAGSSAQASEAAEELQKLSEEIAKLSPEEQQQLASALEQQANDLASTDPELAKGLQQAAEALRNGNTQGASQNLQQAGQQASNANQRLADNAATEQTLSQLQRGRQSIAQAGQNQQQAGQGNQQGQQGQQGQGQEQPGQQGQGQQGQGQQGQQGQGQSGQQGQGQGQGQQGQGQGQPGQQGQGQQGQPGGGGSNADNLGNAESGNSGNVNPNGPGQQFTDGPHRNDKVYQPYKPSGQAGPSEQVSGQPSADGNEQVRPGQYGPGTNNGAQVPYEQVYREYNDAAGEALDRSAIPPHLKEYVRDYFSELSPDN